MLQRAAVCVVVADQAADKAAFYCTWDIARGSCACVVAVCCGVLQCVAMCCSVLQGVAVRCRVLQCVAVC